MSTMKSELELLPSSEMPRTLRLNINEYGRLSAALCIEQAKYAICFATADEHKAYVHELDVYNAAIWIDGAAFDLTAEELPRVKEWLASIDQGVKSQEVA